MEALAPWGKNKAFTGDLSEKVRWIKQGSLASICWLVLLFFEMNLLIFVWLHRNVLSEMPLLIFPPSTSSPLPFLYLSSQNLAL